ncbi:MAG TPA: hypothetical protein VIX37_21650 [Candidatus Sulfotelmatobacter sp.]
MRRKNRKWVAMAVALYLFVVWSAYRWGVAQRPTDGNIFEHIEREAQRKNAEEAARVAAAQPKPTGESRLVAAGPAYVAARYDATHVVFMVVAETESRFAARPQFGRRPTKIPGPAKPAAPLAGFQELWEPDSQALHFFPEIIQKTQPGEQWSLNVSPDSAIPVVIDRTVIAPTGCSLALGFLASLPPDQQAAFAASPQEYFAVRRNAVESAGTPVPSHIVELADWRPSPAMKRQIEQRLNDRMKQELTNIDTRLLSNAASPGAAAGELPGYARPRLKEWIHADHGLTRGEGTLDYDIRAFHLTPDAVPRLFVRARWKLANAPVFLMTAWFKAESEKAESLKTVSMKPESQPAEPQAVLLSSDSSWSAALREGDATGALGDSLDFQTILNQFDADQDGWAELLIHSDQGDSTTISLYLYTDLGLVPMKTPLRRDSQSPQSCVDP